MNSSAFFSQKCKMLKANKWIMLFLFVSNVTLNAQTEPLQQPRTQPSGLNLLSTRELGHGLRPGLYSLYLLLKNPNILKELDLNESQLEKLKAYYDYHQKNIDQIEKPMIDKKKSVAGKDDLAELSRLNNELQTKSLESVAKFDEYVASKLLDRQQLKRLKQIRLQAEGPTAFTKIEIIESLGLSEEQLNEIKQIAFSGNQNLAKAANLPAGTTKPKENVSITPETIKYTQAVEDAKLRIVNIRISTMKAIEKILFENQRVKYKNMIGKPFNFVGNGAKLNDDTTKSLDE